MSLGLISIKVHPEWTLRNGCDDNVDLLLTRNTNYASLFNAKSQSHLGTAGSFLARFCQLLEIAGIPWNTTTSGFRCLPSAKCPSKRLSCRPKEVPANLLKLVGAQQQQLLSGIPIEGHGPGSRKHLPPESPWPNRLGVLQVASWHAIRLSQNM